MDPSQIEVGNALAAWPVMRPGEYRALTHADDLGVWRGDYVFSTGDALLLIRPLVWQPAPDAAGALVTLDASRMGPDTREFVQRVRRAALAWPEPVPEEGLTIYHKGEPFAVFVGSGQAPP
jgi:hypothetical protein